MSEMIERVARAICKAELPTDSKWHLCVPAAVAAIEAMREPTDEMVVEGSCRTSVSATENTLSTWAGHDRRRHSDHGRGHMSKKLDEDSRRFQEWLTRGPGEVYYGGIIKAAAGNEKRRLNKKLATPNLFAHIEHEDKAALEKAEQAWREGDKRVKRARARTAAIASLLDADAGLKITADDLATTPTRKS